MKNFNRKKKKKIIEQVYCILMPTSICFYNVNRVKCATYIFLIGGFVRQGKRKSMREKLSPESIVRLANNVRQKCEELEINWLHIITKVSLRYLIMLFLNELYIND